MTGNRGINGLFERKTGQTRSGVPEKFTGQAGLRLQHVNKISVQVVPNNGRSTNRP